MLHSAVHGYIGPHSHLFSLRVFQSNFKFGSEQTSERSGSSRHGRRGCRTLVLPQPSSRSPKV